MSNSWIIEDFNSEAFGECDNGMGLGAARGLTYDEKRKQLFIAMSHGLAFRQNGVFHCWPRGLGMLDAELTSVVMDSSGWLWVGTRAGASAYHPDEGWRSYRHPEQLRAPQVDGFVVRQGAVQIANGFDALGQQTWSRVEDNDTVIKSADAPDLLFPVVE